MLLAADGPLWGYQYGEGIFLAVQHFAGGGVFHCQFAQGSEDVKIILRSYEYKGD